MLALFVFRLFVGKAKEAVAVTARARPAVGQSE